MPTGHFHMAGGTPTGQLSGPWPLRLPVRSKPQRLLRTARSAVVRRGEVPGRRSYGAEKCPVGVVEAWSDQVPMPVRLGRCPTPRHPKARHPHGNDERPEERHGPQARRPALAGHLVPAPQARQGRRGGALQAAEHQLGQDRRQDVQRRRQGRGRQRRQADDAVPLQRRHVLRLHGHQHLRAARGLARRSSATPPTSCWRTRRRSSPPTRATSSTSSCPHRSSSR